MVRRDLDFKLGNQRGISVWIEIWEIEYRDIWMFFIQYGERMFIVSVLGKRMVVFRIRQKYLIVGWRSLIIERFLGYMMFWLLRIKSVV